MIEKILERLEEEANNVITNIFASEEDDHIGIENNAKSDAFERAIEIVQEVVKEYGNGWIPVETALPTDCDNRFYECIVENHEEDLPMFCQYEEEHGFGFWHDYYDKDSLGFVDSEFKTNEELGCEKVIAWKPIAPYQKGE